MRLVGVAVQERGSRGQSHRCRNTELGSVRDVQAVEAMFLHLLLCRVL
jgi:hypothetical protein